MHADELRQAVAKVVGTLKRSDIRNALDLYRAAKGEERTAAATRLGQAGTTLMERMEGLSPAERRVARLMHLELLGSPDYWESLLGGASDPKTHQAEIVRLTSRVMFATGHLPALVALLQDADGERESVAEGEARLVVRLADAGEKASDPDRLARSIDGIDMLYSACASIARKPATELRLDGIDGGVHRDLRFSGDRDSLSAVTAVIESIPAALADIDPDGEVDLEAIIGSLPTFEHLRTLGSLGTFSADDLKDIGETMYQGALLVLESGVVLLERPSRREGAPSREDGRTRTDGAAASVAPIAAAPPRETNGSSAPDAKASVPEPGDAPPAAEATRAAVIAVPPPPPTGGPVGVDGRSEDVAPTNGSNDKAPEPDEHYEHYLREREAMRKTALDGAGHVDPAGQRRNAVEELLRSLEQTRNG